MSESGTGDRDRRPGRDRQDVWGAVTGSGEQAEPAETGPASTGSASTGPASTGPASTGSASTGPASTGSASTGPTGQAETGSAGTGWPGAARAGIGQAGTSPTGTSQTRERGRGGRVSSAGSTGRVVSRGTSDPRRSRRPASSGGDLLGDLQRWVLRSSAKNMRREFEGQVRRTLGSGRADPGDVWGTATTEPPPDLTESPECAWCPICQAARRMRESNPGLGSQLSGVSDVVGAAVQDAIRAFDGVLSRTAAPARERPADRSSAASGPAASGPAASGPAPSGPADSASDSAERAVDEPGDRG
jgi:hypothetical protein